MVGRKFLKQTLSRESLEREKVARDKYFNPLQFRL